MNFSVGHPIHSELEHVSSSMEGGFPCPRYSSCCAGIPRHSCCTCATWLVCPMTKMLHSIKRQPCQTSTNAAKLIYVRFEWSWYRGVIHVITRVFPTISTWTGWPFQWVHKSLVSHAPMHPGTCSMRSNLALRFTSGPLQWHRGGNEDAYTYTRPSPPANRKEKWQVVRNHPNRENQNPKHGDTSHLGHQGYWQSKQGST